ncbi:MAG TPA: tryptophan synthase subunit alpha [Gemmatimonadaceae bacterium]|nr:tryptophan synthase subunit alpha [Gemmatimonadaceae bacterium]
MASTLVTTSSNRIDSRFDSLRDAGRKALVCYITAGFPDADRSIELMKMLEQEGADVIEVGVPFSDPIADGPVIQRSSQLALERGMTLDGALELVSRAQLSIPIVLFSYLNPLLAAGNDLTLRAIQAGVDGVLVTDLPVGADPPLEEWLGGSDLAFIRLVAPTTPSERMRMISSNGSGFVYLISRLGVTGARSDVPAELAETAVTLRSVTDLPVCIGFGVSTPETAQQVGRIGDGVVVGSALVAAGERSVSDATILVRSLRAALDSVQ